MISEYSVIPRIKAILGEEKYEEIFKDDLSKLLNDGDFDGAAWLVVHCDMCMPKEFEDKIVTHILSYKVSC